MRIAPDMPAAAHNWLFHALSSKSDSPAWQASALDVEHLVALVKSELSAGRRPVRLGGYASHDAPPPDSFSISFDDGHPSIACLAAPALANFGVPATLFVPALFPDQTPYVMGWRELRELQERYGWSIQAHGAQHQRASWRLYGETPAQHSDRLHRDYAQARAMLRDKLGREPELLAYPFGDAPAAAQEAARAAGYAAAFAVDQTWVWDGNRYRIPRIDAQHATRPPVDAGAPPAISVIVPACDRLHLLEEAVCRLLGQTYPRERFEVILVDDGSAVELSSVYAGRDPILSVVRVPNSTPDSFRAADARQLGAASAQFELLVYLDSDVAVSDDYLWHVAWVHAQQRDTVLLGYLSGYNLIDLGYRHTLDQLRAVRVEGTELAIIPDRSREVELARCLDDLSALKTPWTLAYTGNLSLPRSLLDRADGFSTAFTGWGLEDIELGFRLHQAGARWTISRWAIGYHMADPAEEAASAAPRNPFRAAALASADFAPVERNLELFEALHPDSAEVAAYCREFRDSIAEIRSQPELIWVECGGPEPEDWPIADMWPRHPGGRPLEMILERIQYAIRVGAKEVRLIGGDPASRADLDAAFAMVHGGDLKASLEITLASASAAEVRERLRRWQPGSLIILVPPGARKDDVNAALSTLTADGLAVGCVRRLT